METKHKDILRLEEVYGIVIEESSFKVENGEVVELSLFNQHISDCSSLSVLQNLTSLDLDNNQISDCSSLTVLQNLTSLYLGNNQISDCSSLAVLQNLTSLGLDNNQISDCSSLAVLQNLTRLDLRNNQISDCSSLTVLQNLTSLYLGNNQIATIPESFLELDMKWHLGWKVGGLVLDNNPLTHPPRDVIESGMDAVRLYYDTLKNSTNTTPLNEAKLIILGEPNAGKTSFVNRLLYDKFDKRSESTIGTNIHQYRFESRGEEYKLNIWDFGGQEIQQSIHHLFLTSKALYMVVLDARNDESPTKWLETIKGFDKEADIIIAVNQIDVNAHPNINERELRTISPNVVGVFYISCLLNEHHGLNELIDFVKLQTTKIPSIGEQYPSAWLDIKNKLEEYKSDKIPYMSMDTYHSLCSDYGVNREQSDVFLAVLDTIGTVRWFKDFAFANHQVFNPSWLTVGLYAILMAKRVQDNDGLISVQEIKAILRVLNDENTHGFEYKEEHAVFFVEAIVYYKFAFKKTETTYLIPKGFSKKAPYGAQLEKYSSDQYRKYEIKFKDFLPSWILHKLMVQMFAHVRDGHFWFYGFVYSCDGTDALIELNEGAKTLRIFVDKTNTKVYDIVEFCLLKVFSDTIVLDVEKWVFFGENNRSKASLAQLQKFKKENITPYRDNDTLESRPVAELLDYFSHAEQPTQKSIELIEKLQNEIQDIKHKQELQELKLDMQKLQGDISDKDKVSIMGRVKESVEHLKWIEDHKETGIMLYELIKGIF